MSDPRGSQRPGQRAGDRKGDLQPETIDEHRTGQYGPHGNHHHSHPTGSGPVPTCAT